MNCLLGFIGKDGPTISCCCMLFTENFAFQNLDKKVEEVTLSDLVPFSVLFFCSVHSCMPFCYKELSAGFSLE